MTAIRIHRDGDLLITWRGTLADACRLACAFADVRDFENIAAAGPLEAAADLVEHLDRDAMDAAGPGERERLMLAACYWTFFLDLQDPEHPGAVGVYIDAADFDIDITGPRCTPHFRRLDA